MNLVNITEINALVNAAKTVTVPAHFAQRIIPLLDLTNLNDNASAEDIVQLCHDADTALGKTAAICIYPAFIKQARSLLLNTPIKIATVANFPAGKADLNSTLASIANAIKDGAQEIDVVMPYSVYLAGNSESITTFTQACKQACSNAVMLKVILETGALRKPDIIYTVSTALIQAGADFIKSSTGKIAEGCTLEAAAAMLLAIKHSRHATGFKAAGGIRSVQQAAGYLFLIEQILGKYWLTAEKTRIGASSLLKELLAITS